MRVFIAIRLPDYIKNFASLVEENLKVNLPKISWVKPPNLHLTLKFLGEISDKQLDKVKQITSEIASQTSSFKIRLEDIGIFPDLKKARIIWIGSHNITQKLIKIVEILDTELAKLGFPKEKRDFQAHITIGRIKIHIDPSLLEENLTEIKKLLNKKPGFTAQGLTIFQSTLGRMGAVYNALSEDKFKTT